MNRDYAPKGVRFFYIYKTLAHPEYQGYVEAISLKERLLHVKEAMRTLGTEVPWIVDAMDNRLKHALGNRPNSEFVIDPQGQIVRKRSWSDPDELRRYLTKLVGPVRKRRKASASRLKAIPAVAVAAKGVVPRLARPERMRAISVEAETSHGEQPFYCKLRAEVDAELLRNGRGKLYLGFHPDPIYRVHWNNLMRPIRIELEFSEGVKLTPVKAEGPKVKAVADIDPREFLIEVSRWPLDQEITVKVKYFACNDEQGWCKAISQEYSLFRLVDRDAGRSMGRRGAGRGRRQSGGIRRRR